jgi:hypothetical protein
MELTSSSAVVSFSKELEENSISYYEDLIQKYSRDKETFLTFIKENKINIALIQRVYHEAITDAIEVCFSFEGLDTDNYIFNQKLSADASYSNVLEGATEIEEKIQKFYLDLAKVSKSLMTDISRVFERIAEKRDKRKTSLKTLYNNK